MRNLLTAMLVVGLLAAPSFGVVNIKLVVDQPLVAPGGTVWVSIYGQGASGLYAAGGRVSGDNAAFSTVASSMVFDSLFNPPSPFGPRVGSAAANGGWGITTGASSGQGWGTSQTNTLSPVNTLGVTPDWALMAKYQVTAPLTANAVDNLTFTATSYGGFKLTEVDKSSAAGVMTGASITTTPEPVTLALLALGGLLIRRRSH